LEINNELKLAQEILCKSLEIIQKKYLIINDSLKLIVDREKELASAQHKFQECMSWKHNVIIQGIVQFP